ncbi:MAG: hypothetical protein ACREC0_05850 [Methylocella sp.]
MADETTAGDAPPAEKPKYDQAFFLALAVMGKDEWNKWRRANKDVRVTFAGIDFSESPRDEIDFSGFTFGDLADFSGCKWRGARMNEFIPRTEIFAPGRAFFTGSAFGVGANFAGAAFGDGAKFDNTVFKCAVEFTGKSKEQWIEDYAREHYSTRMEASAAFENRHDESGKRTGSGPDLFLAISFANARFDGEAIFSRRSFEESAIFTNARFYSPPDFDAASHLDRIDFTGAYIGFVPPANSTGLPKAKSLFACALFGKSRKRQKTTISNAISISRNAKPSAASLWFNGSKT